MKLDVEAIQKRLQAEQKKKPFCTTRAIKGKVKNAAKKLRRKGTEGREDDNYIR